jgi:hypothetical protein
MKRLAGLTLALALLGSLLAAAPSSAWVRKESQWWVWYVPKSNWAAAQSAQGIDISSPTGVLYVGHAFSATPLPWTHDQVVDHIRDHDAFDVHPLRKLRVADGSAIRTHETVERRTYKWKAYRTDRDERVRGLLTVDIIADDSTFTYGFASYNRVAPADEFDRRNKTLKRIQKSIFFQPRSPDFGGF